MVAEPCSPGSGESGELAVGALGGVRARYLIFYNTLTFNHLVRHSLLATCDLNLDFNSLKTLAPVPSDPIIKESVGNALHECRHLLLPHM